jgi:single-strand DNA-binding protein
VNSVQLLGWLGGDPELRFTPMGIKMCRFNVATKHFGGRDGEGRREYATDWTSVEVWDKLAEQCNEALHKGSRVLIGGSLRSDSWTDKESGQPRYRTFVRADSVLFLDGRPEAQAAIEAVQESEATEEVPF